MLKIFKYQRPDFLLSNISQESYNLWLGRKATTHINRDRKRGNQNSTREEYKIAIHKAVLDCDGKDAYTGKLLDWHLIRTYNNKAAQAGKREYNKKFANMPTVDHVGDGKGKPIFKICSWKVNDAKNSLKLSEFVALCKLVVKYNSSR